MFCRKINNWLPPVSQHHMAQFVSNRAIAPHNALPHLHQIPVRERYPLSEYTGRERHVLDIHHPAVCLSPGPGNILDRSPPRDRDRQHLVHRSNNRPISASIALCKPHEQ